MLKDKCCGARLQLEKKILLKANKLLHLSAVFWSHPTSENAYPGKVSIHQNHRHAETVSASWRITGFSISATVSAGCFFKTVLNYPAPTFVIILLPFALHRRCAL